MRSTVIFLSRMFFRAWLSFATLVVSGWIVSQIMEWENPFRSDDPYIVGLVFGTVGASMAGAYCLLELFGLSRTKTSLLYFLLVGAWCAFLVVCGRGALEAGELLYHGAIVSALSSVGVWLLCMKKMSPWCVRGISAAGTLILLMYAFVMCRFY